MRHKSSVLSVGITFAVGTTVDWLIHEARSMLDPRGTGVLYTFQTGMVQYWLNREMTNSWRQVGAGEQMAATIYEYCRLDGQAMEPTRISGRRCAFTTLPAGNRATAFRAALLTRHPQGVISPTTQQPFLNCYAYLI